MKRNLFIFGSLILSSLGFSLGLVMVRLLGGDDDLSAVLNLQSTVVMLSFLLQFGYRASLRFHVFKRHIRLVELSERFIETFLLLLSIIVVASELFFHSYCYFALSSLIALVTLRLGLSVVREENVAIFFYSVLNLIVCIGGSVGILVLGAKEEISSIVIEIVALLLFLLLVMPTSLVGLFRRRRALANIFIKSQSFQLGSGVITAAVYVLTQSVLIEFSGTSQLAAYADAQVMIGFLILIVSKILLIIESKIYSQKSARINLYLILVLMQMFFSLLISLSALFIYEVDFLVFFMISYVLLSRVVLGYVIQYIVDGRLYLNLLTTVLMAYYIFMMFLGFGTSGLVYHFIPVVLFSAIGVILFVREYGRAESA